MTMTMTHTATPVDDAATWRMTEDAFDGRRLPHYETLFTLANGYAGVRGSLPMSPLLGDPGCYVAGVYEYRGEHATELVNLPCWLPLDAYLDGFTLDLKKGEVLDYQRTLDMRRGLLLTDILWRDDAKRTWRFTSTRLMHQTEKHLGLEWGTITVLDAGGQVHLRSRLDAWAVKHGSLSGQICYDDCTVHDLGEAGIGLQVTTCHTGITVAEASRVYTPGTCSRTVLLDGDRVVEQLVVPLAAGVPIPFTKYTTLFTSRDGAAPLEAAAAELQRLAARPVEELVAEHVQAWAAIWERLDIRIEGDDRLQRAIRFNLFHLASIAQPADERVSLGAKGLHGNGYQGQVYWDTEIYMLPPFVYTQPEIARTLLMYRYHLLPDATENAKAMQVAGVRFPWHSSLTGREHGWWGWQEHLNPDIAYAVDQYVQATGDEAFFLDYGAELIIATAAYWPSRVTQDPEKGFVLCNTCGPDEIHTGINNNAYTNYLIRWHLRRAADAIADLQAAGRWTAVRDRYALTDADPAHWRAIADGLYLPRLAAGFFNQFDGHDRLPERAIDRTMTKMQYVGPVQGSFKPTKVAQQADTVLLYALFPHDFPAAEQQAAYAYYEPRCSHTSTLSRCSYARVAAQCGLTAEAYRQFLLSAETDFGPTAECDSGIHAACLGGNWQVVIMGFAGFSVPDGVPTLAPQLPTAWTRMGFTLVWRGTTVQVAITPQRIDLRTTAGACTLRVNGAMVMVTTEGVGVETR
jgi:kojibiose phosphorylase